MSEDIHSQLIKYLKSAHGMEKQAEKLLAKGRKIAGDDEIAAIYRAHHMQTAEHVRYIAERLEAHGAEPSKTQDVAMQAGALAIGAVAHAAPDTPVKLATTAFAFENFEIASYRMLRRVAERAGDQDTVAVVDRILEEEEAAAELVAGTFDRALEVALGEQPQSPVISVTPIGKPSER